MDNKDIFKNIKLPDRSWVTELLGYSNYRATEYNFTVLYIWREVYKTKIARFKDFLLIRSGLGPGPCRDNDIPDAADMKPGCYGYAYIFPAGRGDVKEALEFIMEDARANGVPFVIHSVLEEQKTVLEELFPGRFSFEPVRNSYDYVYSAKDLITLKGKKYQSKRNFVSRFKSNAGWSYEEVTPQNIGECIQMNDEWCKLYGCGEDVSLAQETCSVRNAINNFEALGLKGGILRLEGRVVAFTLGEKINSDTFLVHIEKAFADIQGAYPAISQLFLQHQMVETYVVGEEPDAEQIGFVYVNREDDAGDLGLRNAKLQYHPVFMIEKYLVAELEN